MAFGIFQFSLVFTIGYYIGLASDRAVALGVNEISLSLHLKNPEDVILAREENAIFKCEAESSAPGLSISWFYDGNPILANDSRVQILSNGSLNISKAAGKKMEGKYWCLAKNDIGAVLSNPAELKIATISRDFIEQPHSINTTEEQPLILPCQIHSIPDAVIYWERDNKTLPQNTRYVPLPTGALLITNTHSTDTGYYRCIAKNKLFKKSKRSKYEQLTVLPPFATNKPPKFLPQKLKHNVTTLTGNNVTLLCLAAGWPTPSVKWVYNGDTIIGNASVLHLHNVTTKITGYYTCTATNLSGRITMNYTVEVYEKPYFNVTPVSISYPSATTARLNCQAKGNPQPKVTWLKDGVPLEIIGRFKQEHTDLVLSHSFTTDAGIYQCVASNIVGQIWASAQLEPLFSKNRPSPPQNVQCHTVDDNSICLIWNSPPNVSIQAYSIHLFNAVKGYEFVTNYTYYLASRLAKNSEYTMYVRSYSTEASDQSNNVSCKTGIQGERNLKIKRLTESSVQLSWSRMSNDFPCGKKKLFYKVQWKKVGQSSVYIDNTSDLKINVSHLRPSLTYEFRVQSTSNLDDRSPWVTYSLHEQYSEVAVTSAYVNEVSSTEDLSLVTPLTPIQVEIEALSPYSVNLTWLNTDEDEHLLYRIHCTDVAGKSSHVFESHTNFLEVINLKPDTMYVFKVRAENKQSKLSPFSHSVEVHTPTDVPSAVQNLKSRIINETAVCVTWKTPIYMNGKLLNYVVSYSSNKNLPLEKWNNVYVKEKDFFINQCWPFEKDEVSTVITDLSADLQYTLVVRAATDAGLGNPAVPITFSTFAKKSVLNLEEESTISDSQDEIDFKQKLGVAVGVSISALCVLCCVSCVIFRRRCVKRDAIRRARLTVSNNYYPSGMPYSATPLHLHQDSCTTEAHEMQQLVMDEGSTHIPPLETTHLDTKGGIGFPNGQLNGSLKHVQMNGHVANGHIHITENPRYDYHVCNGNLNSKKNKKDCLLPSFKQIHCLQENSLDGKHDPQDNCHKIEQLNRSPNNATSNISLPMNTENSKVSLKLLDVSDYNSNCNSDFVEIYNTNMNNTSTELDQDIGLNDTQMTYLDDSFSELPNRIISPALAPNG